MWKPRVTWTRKLHEDMQTLSGDYIESPFGSVLVATQENMRLVIDDIEAWVPGNADNGSLTLTIARIVDALSSPDPDVFNFTQNQPLRLTDMNIVASKVVNGIQAGFSFSGTSSASSLGSPGDMNIRIHYHEEIIR